MSFLGVALRHGQPSAPFFFDGQVSDQCGRDDVERCSQKTARCINRNSRLYLLAIRRKAGRFVLGPALRERSGLRHICARPWTTGSHLFKTFSIEKALDRFL
ncbi:hypothetical protein M1D34_27480 (plasmid) [Ensifer sp. D2-11]